MDSAAAPETQDEPVRRRPVRDALELVLSPGVGQHVAETESAVGVADRLVERTRAATRRHQSLDVGSIEIGRRSEFVPQSIAATLGMRTPW